MHVPLLIFTALSLHSEEAPSGSWFDEYVGLLHDPGHILFEITFSIFFDFVIVYLGYHFFIRKIVIPRLRHEIHREIDEEHHVDHHEHVAGDEELAIERDEVTPQRRIGETLWHLVTNLGLPTLQDWLKLKEHEIRDVISGALTLDAVNAQRVIDLGFVYDAATIDFAPEAAARWLTGVEPFLGGAQPLQAIWLGQTSKVYDALLAFRSGAIA